MPVNVRNGTLSRHRSKGLPQLRPLVVAMSVLSFQRYGEHHSLDRRYILEDDADYGFSFILNQRAAGTMHVE